MAEFDHLRELPDGSLTQAEVGILLNELARCHRIIPELVRNDGFYGGAPDLSDEDMDYIQALR